MLSPGCWRTCTVRPSFAAVGVSGCSGLIWGPGCWQTCTVRPWMRSPGAGSRRRCAPKLPAFSRMIRAACAGSRCVQAVRLMLSPGCWRTCAVRPWMRSPGAGSWMLRAAGKRAPCGRLLPPWVCQAAPGAFAWMFRRFLYFWRFFFQVPAPPSKL